MTFSNEIITVLEYLCTKLGVVIGMFMAFILQIFSNFFVLQMIFSLFIQFD